MRVLIVNADDFGRTAGINRGIAKAHRDGIVTSTSVMVRWPAAAEAAQHASVFPKLSFGLHGDFGEWVFRGGTWQPVYEVVALDDESAITKELNQQLDRFFDILKRTPTHLDTHQHVHKRDPMRSILSQKAAELRIPLRFYTPAINFCGAFYGQTDQGEQIPDSLGAEHLKNILKDLPAGTSELCCHPGEVENLTDAYGTERAIELATLCDPQIRQAIEVLDITLTSFANIFHPPYK
jgi:predicted glycoside hydrolase/deacetylase ChbG (UPF0249 family)